jgi:hypothetical protein
MLGLGFIDGTVTSDVCLSPLSDEVAPLLLGYDIQPHLKDVTLHLTSVVPYFAFFVTFSMRESCRTCILCYFRKDFHDHQSHRMFFCRGGGGN